MEQLLERYFPTINNLHLYQTEAITKVQQGENILVIAPTGGGKSLVYQVSALALAGTAIVISPLKSLMSEQYEDLIDRGVDCVSLHGDIPFQQQRDLLRNLSKRKPKLIYVSPERLHNYFFRTALLYAGLKISMVVIDEAHCISQWGIDFRPEYGMIPSFIEFLKGHDQNPVVISLTATLGKKSRKDIQVEFTIQDHNKVIHPDIIRKNLHLEFMQVKEDKEKVDIIRRFIEEKELKKVIVYLYSKKKCEDLAAEFENADYYHADRTGYDKDNVAGAFQRGSISILFATTAFGLGINIPDIDGVIHHDIPNSVEEYYQQVGRGARKPEACPSCECLCLWSEKNFDTRKTWIKGETIEEQEILDNFRRFELENRSGVLVDLPAEEIFGSDRRRFLYRVLEKYGLCTTIGEVHGYPQTIRFKARTAQWDAILQAAGRRKSYNRIERQSGIAAQDVMKYIYHEELRGNIEYLPAVERIILVRSNFDAIQQTVLDQIINDSQAIEAFKMGQLSEFKQLCDIQDKKAYIAKILDV
jgi:ATP-dependent DNA helicase RecQ